MPPKMMKTHQCAGRDCIRCKNPRVILLPFMAPDSRSELNRYHFTSAPATAELFNKPEFSDLRVVVGEQQYYAHRLILCAASDVFAKMLGTNWSESHSAELVLHEDESCLEIFQQFLFYLYSGSIMICESHVVSLFMLADKYNVKLLYDECVKVIKNGLKVYVVHKMTSKHSVGGQNIFGLSSSSTDSDSSDSDSSEETGSRPVGTDCSQPGMAVQPGPSHSLSAPEMPISPEVAANYHLIASEAFPLTLVTKMLTMCQNERIVNAALYNLEVRLGKQISRSNFAVWNDLNLDLVVQVLSDDYFMCEEHIIFSAAKSWLNYSEERKTDKTITQALMCVRYPLLSARQLYMVEQDLLVAQCPRVMDLIREAMRYKLFWNCAPPSDKGQWTGVQFQPRRIRTDK